MDWTGLKSGKKELERWEKCAKPGKVGKEGIGSKGVLAVQNWIIEAGNVTKKETEGDWRMCKT